MDAYGFSSGLGQVARTLLQHGNMCWGGGEGEDTGEAVSCPAAPTWVGDDGVDPDVQKRGAGCSDLKPRSHALILLLWCEAHAASALVSLPGTHGTQARTQIHHAE